MRRGGVLLQAQIAYETWGELNAEKNNAVLINTGMSPGAHAASNHGDPTSGWWEPVIGAGKPIDTQKYFVICVNSLGSCKGSTGPASIDASTQQAYRLQFPELTLEDIASASHALVLSLGIKKLYAQVGPSMGGMTSMAYATLFPNACESVLLISCAAYAQPFAIGLRSLQREAVRSDPLWNEGRYTGDSQPITGMRLARKLGVISYRSAQEWQDRFDRERIGSEAPAYAFAPEFQIESYLEGHAQRWAGTFDPNSYLYLSRAMDWFDLREHGGSLDAACKRMQVERALVVGVQTDILFPASQQSDLAKSLASAGVATHYVELDSVQGHDSFLVDYDQFCPLIADFFPT